MFSVVIPLYNKELSIRNTIQSVLDQTCQDFEIVVVNDGSTDNSAAVVEAIEDDRIRLIHQKNQGVSAARNRGIKEARYEWIAFLDGDDLWEKAHLQEIKLMMRMYPEGDVFATSFEFYDGRRKKIESRGNGIFKVSSYFEEAIDGNLIWTGIVVASREILVRVSGFNTELTNGEDLDCWARLAKNGTIIKSSTVTATYKLDAENRTSLAKDVRKSHVYYFNLRSGADRHERNYYVKSILDRLYGYLSKGDLKNFNTLRVRYPELPSKQVLIFLLIKVVRRVRRAVGL